jgi:hypothetical protein
LIRVIITGFAAAAVREWREAIKEKNKEHLCSDI